MKKICLLLINIYIINSATAQNFKQFVDDNNTFAIDCYHQLTTKGKNKNFLFSPFSISQIMAIVYEGANNNTAYEIKDALHFSNNKTELHNNFKLFTTNLNKDSDSLSLLTSNSIWPQKGFLIEKEFIYTTSEYYNAPINYVNYKRKGARKKAAEAINTWNAKQTKNLINELLSENDLSKDTRLILANSIYFFAEWTHAFNEKQTKLKSFYSLNSEGKTLFMNTSSNFWYYDDDIVQVLKMPFKGNKQSMIVFLPTTVDGLELLEKNFRTDYLQKIYADMRKQQIQVSLPKLKAEYKCDVKKTLQEMNVEQAFSDKAIFTGIRKQNDLKIDKIIHKSFIEISEKGTEAATSSGAVFVRKSASINKIRFNANHPFIYLITDNKTGAILFLGRLNSIE